MMQNMNKVCWFVLFLVFTTQANAQFITTWQTTVANEDITIPTFTGETYNYNVDWGDGQSSMNQTGDATHTYATAGTYTVTITGTFPRIYFNGGGDAAKVQSIEAWGSNAWNSMNSALAGCINMVMNATDAPDLSGVTDMTFMLSNCRSITNESSFTSWNTSTVTNMSGLFFRANLFNADISNWDMSNVLNTSSMFDQASSFNQDISTWNVSSVTNMGFMFAQAASFDQNLGSWNIASLSTAVEMFAISGLSNENYDLMFIGWGQQATTASGVFFSTTGKGWCNSEYYRDILTNTKSWTITQDTRVCAEGNGDFVTTWTTTTASEMITIPMQTGTNNFDIDWGDGTVETEQTVAPSHTYASAGTYTVKVRGQFHGVIFNNAGDRTKIQSITQWGQIPWANGTNAFYGCTNLTSSATDTLNTTRFTSLQNMFRSCANFTDNTLNGWDVSNVTTLESAFDDAAIFDSPLDRWDVSNVTSMAATFAAAFGSTTSFNQPIANWDVSKVISFRDMFANNAAFNQPIDNWTLNNSASDLDLSGMFGIATAFNQPLNSWDVSRATTMNAMFFGATSFNQPLNSWIVSRCANYQNMFEGAIAFNQNLGQWGSNFTGLRTSTSVITLTDMFKDCGMSTTNYDATLLGWNNTPGSFLVPSFSTDLQYCDPSGRSNLIARGWTITDGGQACPTLTTWDGTAWSAGAPTSSMNANMVGNYNASINGNITCLNLTVNSSSTLTIPSGSSVTIAENLINTGTISVQEEGSLVQTLYTPSNSGTGTYEMQRTGTDFSNEYNYWSSPVVSYTIGSTFGASNSRMYSFDAGSQGWINASSATAMGTGQGFAITGTTGASGSTATRTLSSTTGYHSGEYEYALTYNTDTDTDNDWNLVGNPYPSGISVDSLLKMNYANSGGNIGNAVYLWNSDGNDIGASSADYAIMNTAGVVQAGAGTAPTSTNISSGQGFFVQATKTGALRFENSFRTATNNTFLRTNQHTDKKGWKRAWIGVNLKNSSGQVLAKNELLVGQMPDALLGNDRYDAIKLSGNELLSFYSRNVDCNGSSECKKLAIQGLPFLHQSQIIPIGIEAKEAGVFTFSINHLKGFDEFMELHLYDAQQDISVDLRAGDYTVNLDKGEFNDRFTLRFIEGKVTSLPDDLETPLELGVLLYASQRNINVQFTKPEFAQSEVAIYDISGRQIGLYTNKNRLELAIPVLKSGIYIVRVANVAGVVSKKLFVE